MNTFIDEYRREQENVAAETAALKKDVSQLQSRRWKHRYPQLGTRSSNDP